MTLSVGQRVRVKNSPGIIRYSGETQFSPGLWIGVQLDTPNGKNDGSVEGVKYFECEPKYGVFARPSMVILEEEAKSLPITSQGVDRSPDSRLHTIIDKLQIKLKTASKEIESLKAIIDPLKANISQLEATIEMQSVDSNFYLETNRELTAKLEDLTNKYNEVRIDLQLLQEENEINKQIELEVEAQLGTDVPNSSDLVALKQRNKKLELALINLESVLNQQKLTYTNEINSLKNSTISQLSYDELLAKLQRAELSIVELQDQLESTLDLEKLIEHLTYENEALQEKVSHLKKTVAELSELNELDKSLEENHKAVEQELHNEIALLMKMISKDQLTIKTLESKNKDIQDNLLTMGQQQQTGDYAGSSETTTLLAKIESLQLEIKKLLVGSNSTKISLKVKEAELNCLEDHFNYMKMDALDHSSTLSVLYILKRCLSKVAILINIDHGEVVSETNFNSKLSILTKLSISLKSLISMWESSYKTLSIHDKPWITKLSDLDLELSTMISKVKETLFESTTIKFAPIFIEEVFSLFQSVSESDVVDGNVLKFTCMMTMEQSMIISKLVRGLLGFLQKQEEELANGGDIDSQDSKVVAHLTNQLQSIVDVNAKILAEPREILRIWQDGGIVYMGKSGINQLYNSLESILSTAGRLQRNIEVEMSSIGDPSFDLEVISDVFEIDNRSIEVVLESLQEIQSTMNMKFEMDDSKEDTKRCIYDVLAIPNEVIDADKSSQDISADVSLDMSSQLKECSTSIIEKDRKILELQLSIQLLENNLLLTQNESNVSISDLKQALISLEKKHQESIKSYNLLMSENKSLQGQIEDLLQANQLLRDKKSLEVGGFEDIYSEKENTDKLALIGELHLLRNMLNYYTFNNMNVEEDYGWLKEPIMDHKVVINEDTLAKAGHFLRKISSDAKTARLCRKNGDWRPRESIPRYLALRIKEGQLEYMRLKNEAMRI